MHRAVLALAVAAPAIFITAVYADDGATSGPAGALPQAGQPVDRLLVMLGMPDLVRPLHRRMTPAHLYGRGTLGELCHAVAELGHQTVIDGSYKELERQGTTHLACCTPEPGACLFCDSDDVDCTDPIQ